MLFAGATVVIALLGMFALGVSLLNGAAVAAAIGVVLVLAASLTLLPALLGVIGRADRRGRQTARRSARGRRSEAAGSGCAGSARVQRRPAVTAIARHRGDAGPGRPALGLRLASSDAGNDPTNQTTRQAYDLLAKGFGPGFNGPLQIAVGAPAGRRLCCARRRLTTRCAPPRASRPSTSPRLNSTGTTAAVVAYPTTSPQSAQTIRLVTQAPRRR